MAASRSQNIEDEDATDSDDAEDDQEMDYEAIADKTLNKIAPALRDSETRAKFLELGELSLDCGLRRDQLYLSGRGEAGASFDTACLPGNSTRLEPEIFDSDVALPAVPSSGSREVRGAKVRPVDDSKMRRKEAKEIKDMNLAGWYGLPKKKITPELEKELKAIKLRGSWDRKRFYKANDSNELPTHFTIATEVGGGLAAAGVARSGEVHARSGRSFLSEMLRDHAGQEWTRQKTAEVAARGQASYLSGHGKVKPGKGKKRSTHRGGGWKKTKKA